MAVISADSLVGRSLRGTMYRLGEFVHVCAIYLGIAVLVTLASGAAVPSLREQAAQIHEALLVALRPDVLDGSDAGMLALEDPSSSLPGLSALPAGEGEQTDGLAAAAISQLSFSRALRVAMEGRHAPGMTGAQAKALRSYIARKYKIAQSVAGALVNTAFLVARERNLDPQLVLAVIAIESRYNPFAESHVGAQGLMQVMPMVHRDKFEAINQAPIAALNPIANIRVGTQILHDCIRRRGSIEGGLACYVGATGPGDGGYGAKVLAERRRIALASGIPVGR